MALPYRAEMESAFGMGFGDVLAYGEMAGLALEHGLADMVSTQWVDGPGREFRAAAGPVVTAMIGALRQLDPAAAVPTVTPTAAAAAAADPHL